MKEEFLHYLWKYRLFDAENLCDSDGNSIHVIHPGEYNRDSGPDFFNSRISIGGTLWAGNVEIHVKSSHFDLHGHQNDAAFNNVILHVVAENDKKVYNKRGDEISTVEIKYDSTLYERYNSLLNTPYIIACQDDLHKIDKFLIFQWMNSLLIERLQGKSDFILKILETTGNDWEETLYRMLSRYFGFRVNTEPFESLARAIPFRIIRKHSDNRFQIEALLFGSAGLLDEGLFREALTDEYYLSLLKEYKILSSKYTLHPLHGSVWKFARLRPSNFPTIRISQLAAMLAASEGLFSRVLETKNISELKKLFEVFASEYWSTHFVFGSKTKKIMKKTGKQATEILLINAVIPILFVYGLSRDRQDMCDKAITLLEKTGSEQNVIIKEWEKSGIHSESAFYSQALIQLRNKYCKKRRCLDCRIGNKLIGDGARLKDAEELLLEP